MNARGDLPIASVRRGSLILQPRVLRIAHEMLQNRYRSGWQRSSHIGRHIVCNLALEFLSKAVKLPDGKRPLCLFCESEFPVRFGEATDGGVSDPKASDRLSAQKGPAPRRQSPWMGGQSRHLPAVSISRDASGLHGERSRCLDRNQEEGRGPVGSVLADQAPAARPPNTRQHTAPAPRVPRAGARGACVKKQIGPAL